MKTLDSERQCYYDCGKDDIVRVDTTYHIYVKIILWRVDENLMLLLLLNSKVFAGEIDGGAYMYVYGDL